MTRDGIAALLRAAWAGERPAGSAAAGPARITEQVVETFAGTADPRLRTLLTDLVRRLHAFAVDNDLTQDEWQQGIDFLTRAGHITTDTRQEFVLLSDTLGLSSVVDVLTNSRTPDSTPSAVLGPFYVEGPPDAAGPDSIRHQPRRRRDAAVRRRAGHRHRRPNRSPTRSSTSGSRTTTASTTCSCPTSTARCCAAGCAPTTRAGCGSGRSSRRRTRSRPTGRSATMLAATGRHPYRAPHLHFMIGSPGHRQLITQLFVRGGDYLDSDAVFGVKDDLIVDFVPRSGPTPDGRAVDGEWRELTFTFRLAPG